MATGREMFAQGILVRLFRAWSACRSAGAADFSRMHEIVAPLKLPDETVPACASLFELVEAHLERALDAECCCSQRLSADERALLGVVSIAPTLQPATSTVDVPHGLPGAICWAAMVVRHAFAIEEDAALPDGFPEAAAGCPFVRRDSQPEALRGV